MTHLENNISRRSFFKLAALATITTSGFSILPANAAKLNVSNGVAIQGYDPVAYFNQNMPVKGDAAITMQHEGATYQFASAANRDAFKTNPSKFAPQYGGFCAYAVSKGYTAPIDPVAFSVVDNRLYLNFSPRVKTLWQKDIPGNISKANKNWPKLSSN